MFRYFLALLISLLLILGTAGCLPSPADLIREMMGSKSTGSQQQAGPAGGAGGAAGGAGGGGVVFNLPRQFSDSQGQNNWYYFYGSPTGRLTEATWDNLVAPWGTVPQYDWNGGPRESGPRYLEITGRDLNDWRNPGPGGFLQPGEGADITFGWKAPQPGTIQISAMLNTSGVDANATSETDDGVWLSIWKGSTCLTDEKRIFRGNNESNRIDHATQKVSATVAAGEMIYFYVRRGNWQDCDGMYYSFSISYNPVSDLDPPVSRHRQNGNQMNLTATDNRSGVAVIEYRYGDLPWSKYEGPITLPPGTYKFIYRAVDNMGNTEPYHHLTVNLNF
ncbi:MAG: hypothetical protein QHH75_11400 [Bacillota bacterium]|nr:hypothetical protein [Bacillota bacterium]